MRCFGGLSVRDNSSRADLRKLKDLLGLGARDSLSCSSKAPMSNLLGLAKVNKRKIAVLD